MHKFISKSHIALSVALIGGGNAHVPFSEVTGKGSVFYTDNEKLAESLRKHRKYGKLFKEVAIEEEPAADAAGTVVENPATESQGTGNQENVLTFDNNEDAKDYLAEKYGISRSKMRTRAAIVEAAKGVGVTVNWGEAGGAPADAAGETSGGEQDGDGDSGDDKTE